MISRIGNLLIVLLLVQLFIMLPGISDERIRILAPNDSNIESQSYTSHDFIAIMGNEDFLSQAASEGWEGTGSAEDPIIISGYHIQDERHLLRVVNTDLHFIFRANLLDGISGVWCGLYLANVTNGNVVNNIVKNAAIGLHMQRLYNCTIENNEIYDNYHDGIVLELPCIGNNITSNQIYSNAECGIILDYGCQDNIIADNDIYDNLGTGIYLWQFTSEPLIANNSICRNLIAGHPIGISLQGVQNLVTNNTIEDSSLAGILCNGNNNTMRENIITNGGRDGISLYSYASSNWIVLNSISNNTLAGLKVSSNSDNNTIRHNDFIWNNDTLQVCDDGMNNEIELNYYSNWNSPDNDGDNYVDFEYPIFGNANNTDTMPCLEPNVQYLEEWYIHTNVLATSSEIDNVDDNSSTLLLLLPATGIALLLFIGVVYNRKFK